MVLIFALFVFTPFSTGLYKKTSTKFPRLFQLKGKVANTNLWFLYFSQKYRCWVRFLIYYFVWADVSVPENDINNFQIVGQRRDVHRGSGWLRSSICTSPESIIVSTSTVETVSERLQSNKFSNERSNSRHSLVWHWYDKENDLWKPVHKFTIKVQTAQRLETLKEPVQETKDSIFERNLEIVKQGVSMFIVSGHIEPSENAEGALLQALANIPSNYQENQVSMLEILVYTKLS